VGNPQQQGQGNNMNGPGLNSTTPQQPGPGNITTGGGRQ